MSVGMWQGKLIPILGEVMRELPDSVTSKQQQQQQQQRQQCQTLWQTPSLKLAGTV